MLLIAESGRSTIMLVCRALYEQNVQFWITLHPGGTLRRLVNDGAERGCHYGKGATDFSNTRFLTNMHNI
jgi:hypothetical protein